MLCYIGLLCNDYIDIAFQKIPLPPLKLDTIGKDVITFVLLLPSIETGVAVGQVYIEPTGLFFSTRIKASNLVVLPLSIIFLGWTCKVYGRIGRWVLYSSP
jgi:hypothetical protein